MNEHRVMYDGTQIPAIGLGTFGSDHVSPADVASAVKTALDIGYRYIDCAQCYGNEKEIGAALKESGVPREELFLLSKVWNDNHSPENVRRACEESLAALQTDYLDCYLVHWPFPNYHAPGCDVDARNPDSRPYIHEEFMETWRAMEKLVDDGLVRHIGTSNVTIPKLELILRDARIKPAVNELEMHPSFQQGQLFQYLLDHDIVPIGYSPVGSPARPERDRTPDDVCDIEMPVIKEIAARHGIHPAVLCVKWAAQRGQIPIPFSTKESHLRTNFECISTEPLTDAEMNAIASCERNSRLIKGQVFLWETARDWLDLWDVNGKINGGY